VPGRIHRPATRACGVQRALVAMVETFRNCGNLFRCMKWPSRHAPILPRQDLLESKPDAPSSYWPEPYRRPQTPTESGPRFLSPFVGNSFPGHLALGSR
jgi:hypothetical protein